MKGLNMKYLKNIINNIKWFVCNDIYSYSSTSTYNSNAYSQIVRNIENDLLEVQKVLPNIVNIEKDLQISNGVINENYRTLLNKSIDNKNKIKELEVLIDSLALTCDNLVNKYDNILESRWFDDLNNNDNV